MTVSCASHLTILYIFLARRPLLVKRELVGWPCSPSVDFRGSRRSHIGCEISFYLMRKNKGLKQIHSLLDVYFSSYSRTSLPGINRKEIAAEEELTCHSSQLSIQVNAWLFSPFLSVAISLIHLEEDDENFFRGAHEPTSILRCLRIRSEEFVARRAHSPRSSWRWSEPLLSAKAVSFFILSKNNIYRPVYIV